MAGEIKVTTPGLDQERWSRMRYGSKCRDIVGKCRVMYIVNFFVSLTLLELGKKR